MIRKLRVWRYSLVVSLVMGVWADATASGRVLVRQVRIDGAHRISEDRVRGWLMTRAGLPADSLMLEKDMARILDGYVAEGYWQASVAFPEVELDRGRVRFRIEEGRRTFIDTLRITGNKHVATDSLLNEVFSRERVSAHQGIRNDGPRSASQVLREPRVSLLFAGARGKPGSGQRLGAGSDRG